MTTDELVGQMHTLMWNAHLQQWDARAQGCFHFGRGPTPREAMMQALRLRDGVQSDDEPNADLF